MYLYWVYFHTSTNEVYFGIFCGVLASVMAWLYSRVPGFESRWELWDFGPLFPYENFSIATLGLRSVFKIPLVYTLKEATRYCGNRQILVTISVMHNNFTPHACLWSTLQIFIQFVFLPIYFTHVKSSFHICTNVDLTARLLILLWHWILLLYTV